MQLEALGAGPAVFGAFVPYASQGLILARVAVSQRDLYRLYTADGECAAEPSGALWYRTPDAAGMPVAGDWVAARLVAPGQAIVEAVLPRRTCFSRRAAGGREREQPLAANIDLVFLVSGLDGDFNPRRIERYLALAVESGARAMVVLNKSDACPDLPARLRAAAEAAGGAPVVACSALKNEGLEALRAAAASGTTVALLGSSGAGKSTLVNRLLGEERFRTGEVRESDSRGRHTTTRRELVPLPGGGVLIDTPGLRELQLWAGTASVAGAFDEIAALAAECRYRDCTHGKELGCAVQAALGRGEVSPERLASFHKLHAEAQWHETLSDPLAALERKRKWKAIHKAARRMYKARE